MSDYELLRIETSHMTDRDLLLEILHNQRLQNGTVAALKGDFYGDTARGIEGVKPKVEQHDADITRVRTIARAYAWLLGTIGVGNLLAWIRVFGA